MNDKITIREAQETEITLIQELVKEMATYERRPEDMTGTQEELRYWLFERKIAIQSSVRLRHMPMCILKICISGRNIASGDWEEFSLRQSQGERRKKDTRRWSGAVWTGIHRLLDSMRKSARNMRREESILNCHFEKVFQL